MRIGDQRQWYFTVTVQIPEVKHKVRIVVLWRYKNDAEACKILVTNRITWEVRRIVRVYRRRWTGTETFHRDGKQQLGWETVSCVTKGARPGTCTSSCWRTVS